MKCRCPPKIRASAAAPRAERGGADKRREPHAERDALLGVGTIDIEQPAEAVQDVVVVGAETLPLLRAEGEHARSFELGQLPREGPDLVRPPLGLLLGVGED